MEGYPLYADAVNEKGLAMAGLNFPGNAFYPEPEEGTDSVASFELIPWILGRCASVKEAAALLKNARIVNLSFAVDSAVRGGPNFSLLFTLIFSLWLFPLDHATQIVCACNDLS